jgi:nucleosome binding factor SPN SPT16 subunit
VQFSLKQFDLVLIFKDFARAPLHINSIQTAQLDDVKSWLEYVDCRRDEKIAYHDLCSSVDIPLSTGPVNLNWGPIMKTINDSPYAFFKQGGWRFLGGPDGGKDVRVAISNNTCDH